MIKNKKLVGPLLAISIIMHSSSFALAQVTPVVPPPVVISEVQTNGEGTGTTSLEFIELYNTSAEPVSLLDWQLLYRNSSGNDSSLFTFTSPILLLPGAFVTGKLASATTFLPDVPMDFTYTSGLAATAGGLLLKDNTAQTVHSVFWRSSSTYVDDQTVVGLAGGLSAQLGCDAVRALKYSGVAVDDYSIAAPTPRSMICDEPITVPDSTPDSSASPDTGVDTPPQTDVTSPDDVTDTPQSPPAQEPSQNQDTSTTTPAETNNATVPTQPKIRINEVFVDPVSPLTDAADEYVELFNPNGVTVNLGGYAIVAGATTQYRYTFPPSTTLPPGSFIAVTSGDSPLTLSNSGGRVMLLDSANSVVDEVLYTKAVSGAAWALNTAGVWEWTTTPTKADWNLITLPVVKATTVKVASASTVKKPAKATSASASSKKTNFTVAPPVQLNEVFPDPKSPQTDAKDEFIEIYNPHPFAINITDYIITAGTATKTYKYVLPKGSVIQAQGYYVITSDETPIALNNSGATIALINNFDKEIDATTYGKPTPGSAWARDQFGKWQWTNAATKGAENIFQTVSSASGDTKKTNVAGATTFGSDDKPLVEAPQPIKPWLLALIGIGAVCYAAYEYRFEIRNSIYRFRSHRSTR